MGEFDELLDPEEFDELLDPEELPPLLPQAARTTDASSAAGTRYVNLR